MRHLRLATKYLHIGPRRYEGITRHRQHTSLPPHQPPPTGKLFWCHQPLLDIRTNWSCAQGKHPRGEARPPSNRSLPNIIKHRKWVRHEIGSIFTVASGPMKASPQTGKLFWGLQPLLDIRTNCSCAQGKHPLGEPKPPSSKLLPNIIKHRKWVRHLRLATKYLHIGPRRYEGITRHRQHTSLPPHQPLHQQGNYSGATNPCWTSEQIGHVLRESTHGEKLGLQVADR